MSDKELTVSGNYEALVEYVKTNLLREEIKEIIEENRCYSMAEALTDALIRYTEGIETACRSEEVLANREARPVTWVDKRTNKAIAVNKAIREAIRNIIISMPIFILNYMNDDKISIASTIFQILISAYINNKHELGNIEIYCYFLGYYHMKEVGERYFSIKDIIAADGDDKKLLINKSVGEIKIIYSKLESYGLIEIVGELYRIVF